MKRVGLFGTRFTMQASFYPDVFEPAGISLIVPSIGEQDYIHAKYMGELVDGIVLPETRRNLVAVVERLRAVEGIEGLILGGTELSLIFPEERTWESRCSTRRSSMRRKSRPSRFPFDSPSRSVDTDSRAMESA
jgi:aspartate/glutamate racemase